MRNKIISYVLLAAILVQSLLCLVGCDTPDKPETKETDPAPAETALVPMTNEKGASLFTVIRPEEASNTLKKAFSSVKTGLTAVLGTNVEFSDDWVGRNVDIAAETKDKYEILIGNTNRPESQKAKEELGENEYMIRLDGKKIVILGANDSLTSFAAGLFLDGFKTNGELVKKENVNFMNTMEMKVKYEPSQGAFEGTYSVGLLDGYYKTEGRTFMEGDGLALLYSAASFEFRAHCYGDVTITMVSDSVGAAPDWAVYFTAFVDGDRVEDRFMVGNGTTELKIASDLLEGDHTFELYRQTEWDRGNTHVNAITLTGTILEPPADKDLYIEFVGDSLTSGFGNLSAIPQNGRWGGAPILQDATISYGFLTAKELDADMSIVAIQGIGCVCGPQTITMNQVYRHFPYVNKSSFNYDFPRKADIVVINMGTNDYENYQSRGIRVATIMEACEELAKMVRESNPGCKIVWATGMQPCFTTELKSVIEGLGGAENGYYYFKLKQNLAGHDYHTDEKGHRENAKLLTAFLKTIM